MTPCIEVPEDSRRKLLARRRSSGGMTLVETSVALLVGGLVLGLSMQSWTSLHRSSDRRATRSQDLGRGILAGEQISCDLERAMDESLPYDAMGEDLTTVQTAPGQTREIAYEFDEGTGELLRLEEGSATKVTMVADRVEFVAIPVPVETGDVRTTVVCQIVKNHVPEQSSSGNPTVNPLVFATARVLRPVPVSVTDQGWVEPAW